MEKKLLGIMIFMLFLLSSNSMTIEKDFFGQGSTNSGYDISIKTNEIKIDFPTPVINEGKSYATVELGNQSYPLSNPGEPIIPCHNKVLAFPLGTKIRTVNIEYSKVETIKIYKKVIPAKQPVLLDGRKHKIKMFEKDGIYASNMLYPSHWLSYTTSGGLYNDEHATLLSIHIFPVRYSPKKDILFYIKNASITVEYSLPKELFIPEDKYDLLIICPKEFEDELERLKEHKEDHCIRTTIETVEEIYSNYNGKDKAEEIKYAVKDAIEESGIKYVLLVGGLKGLFCDPTNQSNWYVPARYSHLDLDGYPEQRYLCDLYFADIYDADGKFCSWNSNGNRVFGEWKLLGGHEEKDERDLSPDVYAGRLPCRNKWEAKIIVDKIITYEDGYPAGQEWFDRMLLLGGDSYDDTNKNKNYLGIIEGKYANERAYENATRINPDCNPVGLWPEGGKELTVKNFLKEQSKGSGLTFLSGHGDWGTWYNHPRYADFQNWTNIRRLHLTMLTNGDRLPVAVVGGCHTAGFDKNIWEGSTYFTVECFSWALTRKVSGGSIATLGDTSLEYGMGGKEFTEKYGGYLETHFFEVYGNGTDMLGEIWGKEITDYVNKYNAAEDMLNCKVVENWVLLGDPSLKIGGYEK